MAACEATEVDQETYLDACRYEVIQELRFVLPIMYSVGLDFDDDSILDADVRSS